MSATAIGIDLGTSNTCVAVWKNGRVETIPNKLGEFITPSWVSFTDKEIVIGKTAKRNAYKNEKNTVFGVKRIIGRKFSDPVVSEAIDNWKFKIIEDDQNNPQIEIINNNQSKHYHPEYVSGVILTEMKHIAQAYIGVDEIVNAVITVPAYFNDHQRQATKDAAKIAGLNVLRLINEPTSAAIAYVFDILDRNQQNILVYDLGGGTFDVTVLSVTNGNIAVKATLGDTSLGGLNFDQRCIEHFLSILHADYEIDPTFTQQSRFLRRLEEQVERAKHDLSTSVSTSLELLAAYNNVDVFEEFSRARFDDLNEDLYFKTIEIVEQCLKEAKLQIEDIDKIVLVGGSTRIPKIQELLQDYFEKPLSSTINADHAVAHGAAILAAHLSGELVEMSLNITEVTSMSLGIEILNNEVNVLIPRNTPIPCEQTCVYTTSSDDEKAIRITILEGDYEAADQNLLLDTFNLLDLPCNPLVEITFKIDIDGIVMVTALEYSSGTKKTINVELSKGRISNNELDKWKRECEEGFEETMEYQLVKKLRNEIERDLIKMEQKLNRSNSNYQTNKNSLLKINEIKLWMSRKDAFSVDSLKTQKLYLNSLNTTK